MTKPAPTPAVLDPFQVLDASHRELLAKLDELTALVADLRHSGVSADAQVRAGALIPCFSTNARQHNEDEERHIFPAILQSADNDLKELVLFLQEDHAWIELDWLDIEQHLNAVATGTNAYDIEALDDGVDVLATLWREHITLEEAVLYPQARSRIPVADRQSMKREMIARRRRELKGASDIGSVSSDS